MMQPSFCSDNQEFLACEQLVLLRHFETRVHQQRLCRLVVQSKATGEELGKLGHDLLLHVGHMVSLTGLNLEAPPDGMLASTAPQKVATLPQVVFTRKAHDNGEHILDEVVLRLDLPNQPGGTVSPSSVFLMALTSLLGTQKTAGGVACLFPTRAGVLWYCAAWQ